MAQSCNGVVQSCNGIVVLDIVPSCVGIVTHIHVNLWLNYVDFSHVTACPGVV